MRLLAAVDPTSEQLPILADSGPGYRLIRGAAGSGKTTTALLRLKQLCRSRVQRRARLGVSAPVRVLVLTYNRTLEGYITELARAQVVHSAALDLEVTTFSRWAKRLVGRVDILDRDRAATILRRPLANITTDTRLLQFYVDEVEYALSRFTPQELDNYLTKERTGRGLSPRVELPLRRRFLEEVVPVYTAAKREAGVMDWNDLALATMDLGTPTYDIVIVDEAQDFSANQVRAVVAHEAAGFSTTFVLDAVQRIYPRFFTWGEVGIVLRPNLIYRLRDNHRNTAEIAAFARPLVEGLPLDDDGSLPDFRSCVHSGPRPKVVAGAYRDQLKYMLDDLIHRADLTTESVAILQPRGGRWFDHARLTLTSLGVPFCELTRQSVWPSGPEQVGLSTIHSAKGLEFDHVLIPGLNQEVTPHGDGEGDTSLEQLRRLIAMGIGRARRSVMIGYKPQDVSTLISLLDPATYDRIDV